VKPARTPYQTQGPRAFWRDAVARPALGDLDPVAEWPVTIDRNTRVATAGSCFAQHIARKLVANGYNYFVAEPPHPLLSADQAREFNYGTFSARYGNIYTSRQLLQLALRAWGELVPKDEAWYDAEHGCWIDPFRPNIQPGGFACREELLLDREAHFAAVRRLFTELDVFIFTLGLTECWLSRDDGAAYPLCPGVAGGTFDPRMHRFHNLEPSEVIADLDAFVTRLRGVCPACRIILTVSPVPLIATATAGHVLSATVYSKSVLRVAAESLSRRFEGVAYFPSYEIITSPSTRGRYFADDCRNVTESGVDHVMGVFFRHASPGHLAHDAVPAATADAEPAEADFLAGAQRVIDTICEENLIDQHVHAGRAA
jgi:hypothetical protein